MPAIQKQRTLRGEEPTISVVVPVYNARHSIGDLFEALLRQTDPDFDIFVGDDGSTDGSAAVAENYAVVVRSERNRGPAFARNMAARRADGSILLFIDSDCVPQDDWVQQVRRAFRETPGLQVLMGKYQILRGSFLIDCMSAIGFPAGGHLGFEKVWRVDPEGYTDHISSGNFAISRELFWKLNGFNESFPFNCEDAELSWQLKVKGVKIKYCPQVVILHPPADGILDFVRDHMRRGEGNFILKRRIGEVRDLVRLRLWSTQNLIAKYWNSPKLPFALFFLLLAFVLQQVGYFRNWRRFTARAS